MIAANRTSQSAPQCGACGAIADDRVGELPFYLPTRDASTRIWRCPECGTYTRDINIDDPELRRHFEVASYTDPRAEHRFRTVRSGYFVYLQDLLIRRLCKPLSGLRVLDFGCSYGHFLELLRESGAFPEGVEIAAAPRESARQRGLTVHVQVPRPQDALYDVIVAIDSLYYTNDPVATLGLLRGVLKPGGILLVRVTNRVWYLDFLRALGVALHRDRFGDAKFNFSPAGTVRMIERAGFRPREVIWVEKGKADPRLHIRVFYKVAGLLSEYMSLHWTAGILLFADTSSTQSGVTATPS